MSISAVRRDFFDDSVCRVYVSFWRKSRIVKVGVTTRTRWRGFHARGATTHALTAFDSLDAALAHERDVLTFLAQRGSRAFTCRAEAAKLLGNGGAGWSECYRLDADPAVVLRDAPILRARQEALFA